MSLSHTAPQTALKMRMAAKECLFCNIAQGKDPKSPLLHEVAKTDTGNWGWGKEQKNPQRIFGLANQCELNKFNLKMKTCMSVMFAVTK